MHGNKKIKRMFKILKSFIVEVLSGFNDKSIGKDIPTGNVRLGVNTTSSKNSNILYDETLASDKPPQVSVCLVYKRNKVLSVTRGQNLSLFGLPGGYVELGETPEDAAARELYEETGLTGSDFRLIFSMKDGLGRLINAYVCKVSGKIKSSDEGVTLWVDPTVLVSDLMSPFAEYNKKLFHKLGIL